MNTSLPVTIFDDWTVLYLCALYSKYAPYYLDKAWALINPL